MTGRRLLLLRHARTKQDPSSPAATWGLTAPGLESANLLAASPEFSRVSVVASSHQTKMVQTVTPLVRRVSATVRHDDDLRESDGDTWLGDSDR